MLILRNTNYSKARKNVWAKSDMSHMDYKIFTSSAIKSEKG